MILANTTKACSGCKRTKPTSEFYADKNKPDGLKGQCKTCHEAGLRRWRYENPDKVRGRKERYYRAHCDEQLARTREWQDGHPGALAAHGAVNRAIAAGELRPPATCPGCGRPDAGGKNRTMVAHHTDYTRPLDIEWLCHRCHRARHQAATDGA